MIKLLAYFLFCTVLSFILIMALVFRFNLTQTKEKISPFECGFDPCGSSRLMFCMKFFLIGVIFLVFDVEICLILPLPFGNIYLLLFFVVLLVGLIYE